jgi:hypothetical protein
MDRNKNFYNYIFSNNERHTMTPVEAHNYANKLKIDIWQGPGYLQAKREKAFDGFGWHDSLRMNFRGPAHYRQYLKENNMHEAGVGDNIQGKDFEPPVWNEELIRKAINEYHIPIGSVMAEALLSGELDFPEE